MIEASDFDELVFSCSELLQNAPSQVVIEVADTINTSPNYAAMTTMALYKAASFIDFDLASLDSLILEAEGWCPSFNVLNYKKVFIAMRNFEAMKTTIIMDKHRFIVPPSDNLH